MSKVSGKEIIRAIVENMREGGEDLRYSIQAPGIYRIYLHEGDYRRLLPVARQLAEEAKQALDEELDRLNRKAVTGGGLLRMLKDAAINIGRQVRAVIFGQSVHRAWTKPGEGWRVSFNPDLKGEIRRGELRVSSELRLPPIADLDQGPWSRTLTTIRRRGDTRPARKVYAVEELGETPTAPAAADDDWPTLLSPTKAYALIHYGVDERPRQTFHFVKDEVVVGRGGGNCQVDLILGEGALLSREHFRLRRDARTGKIYIRDTSKFGTKVNGHPLPRWEGATGGGADFELELPPRAEIELAGALTIQFESLR